MQEIYFVRHCTSDASVRDENSRPLSESGKKEADALVEYFRDIPVGRVVSSPYLRSIQTVEGIAATHDVEIELDEDFREREAGVWVDDFKEFVRKQWEDFDYSIPGGESLREVMRRNLMALGRVLDNTADVTVVGTHGTALSVLINAYDEHFGYEDFFRIINRMPWVVRFTFDGSRLVRWQTVNIEL